jgi:predicted dehydrogenase
MKTPLNIGLIGLDTSHVVNIASALNDPQSGHHVPGARISVGYPGGSPDFEKSASRVEGFTTQLRTEFDVTMLESPEAVAEQCDAVIMTTVDGRKHLEQFSRIAGFRKPVFVDKPFAVSSDHALQIVTLAHKQGTPLMSCSAMRYAESLTKELADVAKGPLVGIDLFGPMPIEPTQGTYFWYGIHQAEAMFAALGPGCVDVQAVASESDDVVIGRWKDWQHARLSRSGTILRGDTAPSLRGGGNRSATRSEIETHPPAREHPGFFPFRTIFRGPDRNLGNRSFP